ncbi:hypothetical protein Aab01nite_41450 [Paractinoplanes abujensis]|uniref:Uncharacterized membrane protein YoaK (UPF0700 family) n=1 Tax=Paractinoplanes abujensis TaxID=882441 RepID=A0A7W7CT42_9ACTN|nr:hypothetical protein [Actinoplanes abujensis]MBB4694231.1 uncharacterized membrane protein YoaK (UPF0700 family) [Actinoplanes abujensis]GID20555.1 hypothetical protein Aab01nite_41450 [Actinoplanes abujensis]
MGDNGARQGIRELVQVAMMWLGFGEPEESAAPARTGAAFLLVQTVAAIVLAIAAGVIYAAVKEDAVPATWPLPYLLLVLPLAIAVARRPGAAPLPLAAALPAGALTAAAALALLPGSGFWAWFTALAAAALTAGAAFGAVAARRTRVSA